MINKQNIKKIISNSTFLQKLYLKLYKNDKISFNRNSLYKYSDNSETVEINDITFNKKIDKDFFEISNKKISRDINSVLGWIPFIPKKTSAVFYNFFSQNYSLRKNLLLRLSLIYKDQIVFQKLLSLNPNSIFEIDNDILNFDGDAEHLIIELFHPSIQKNHGGHGGHLRFWGKYHDADNNYTSTTHSMPLNFNLNFIKKQKLSRSYVKFDSEIPHTISNFFLNSSELVKNERLEYFGYGAILDKNNNPVSLWHLAANNKKNDEKVELTQSIWMPDFEGLDPYILIDENETGLDIQNLEIFIIKDDKIFKRKIIHNFKGTFFKKISDIFSEIIIGSYTLFVKFNSIGHSYFNCFYNNKLNIGDQVHSHDSNWIVRDDQILPIEINSNGNTRKFFHIDKSNNTQKDYLILNIDKIKNKKYINLTLRLITDLRIEKIKQLEINYTMPILVLQIDQIFKDIDRYVNKCAIIQIESFDHNINGSMLKMDNKNIAVDHLTGG